MTITEQRPAEQRIPRRFQDPHHITAKKRKNEFYMTIALWRAMGEPERLAIADVSQRVVYLHAANDGPIRVDRRWQLTSRHLWRIMGQPKGGERYAVTEVRDGIARIQRTPMKEQSV